MRLYNILAIATIAGLQGCVVPAAKDALTHWDDYGVVAQRQVDARTFRAIISTAHMRGVFDPLGGHGATSVVRSVDVGLWLLTITDHGVEIKKEDARTFNSKEEIDGWYYSGVAIDMVHGRIALTPAEKSTWGRPPYHEGNLQIDSKNGKAHGLVNGKECAVSWQSFDEKPFNQPEYVVSDDGDHLMILAHYDKPGPAIVLNICNPNAPSRRFESSAGRATGFTTSDDGSPRVIRRIRVDRKAASGQEKTYEVQLYPGSERLALNEKNLGLNERLMFSPDKYMFDEQTRRFYWIVGRFQSPRFKLISHDAVSGKTVTDEFSIPGP